MKILILCTYFPPDTGVPAKRPYYLAKYLSEFGHDVTVIRSGKITTMPDDSFYDFSKFKILSYCGENSDAELYTRGKKVYDLKNWRKFGFLNNGIRDKIKNFYHLLISPFNVLFWCLEANDEYNKIKKVIKKISNDKFDVVISTFSNISNAYGAMYAKKIFNCKWIMDFRDIISDDGENSKTLLEKIKFCEEQKIVKKADYVVAVSNGLCNRLKKHCDENKFEIIYNGYVKNDVVNTNEKIDATLDKKKFNICYTGTMYLPRTAAAAAVIFAIKRLISQGKISKDKICFIYAGSSDGGLGKMFKENEIGDIYIDVGYLLKNDVMYLQNNIDLYLSLNHNTSADEGCISGKFAEGIGAKKNILFSVSGNGKFSEMYLLNKKYNFGYVYECSREDELFDGLCNYIFDLYNKKIVNGKIDFYPNPEIFNDFSYEELIKKYEEICNKIIKQ